MKIRQDFVTNSSSVSYIVTFCPSLYKVYEDLRDINNEDEKRIKISRIRKLLVDDLFESGTRVYLEGHELYVKKYEFDTDETFTDESLKYEKEEVNFKEISDEDLWSYIRGQFLGMGDLGHIGGFGVTQVETY